jgi:hypothetical protein
MKYMVCFYSIHQNEVDLNWRLPADMNLSLPVSPDHVTKLMDAYRYIYRSPLPDNFTNYFEVRLTTTTLVLPLCLTVLRD